MQRPASLQFVFRLIARFGLVALAVGLAGCSGAVDAYLDARRLNEQIQKLVEDGRLADALVVAEKIAAQMRIALFAEDSELIGTLVNVGTLYQQTGQFGRAEEFLKRALDLQRKLSGQRGPTVSLRMVELAQLYGVQRRYAEAAALQREAIEIMGSARRVGPDHPYVAQQLRQLARYQRSQGLYADAVASNVRALRITDATTGRESTEAGGILVELADLYVFERRSAEAGAATERALAIFSKAFGSRSSLVGLTLNTLAYRWQSQEQYVRAAQFYRRALEVFEDSEGHPPGILFYLATVQRATGDVRGALATLREQVAARERALGIVLDTGSEEQKRLQTAWLDAETAATVSLHAEALPRDADALGLALTTVLRRKGRLLDVMAHNLDAVRRGLGADGQALFDQWTEARASYAELALSVSEDTSAAEGRRQRAELAARIERLEAEIAARNPAFHPRTASVTLPQIQQALPHNAALVEFVVTRPFEPRAPIMGWRHGPARYVAYVVVADGPPRFMDLGPAPAIDREVTRLREALSDPARDARGPARALDELTMRPLRALVGERRLLFVSADGALNLVPFGALVDERERYLAESFTLAYLTSGRDLLRRRVTQPRQAAVILASPDFDATITASPSADSETETAGLRTGRLADLRWSALPGTAEEARALRALLPTATVVVGAEATKAALKKLRGPAILHLATHGFFLTDPAGADEPASAGPGDTRWSDDRPRSVAPENPLVRSGLALAGANGIKTGSEHGVLTALEAAALDLSGTRLVVLSACETGVGAVQGSEGVYGLRRAFVMAGAETQVVSLWKVEDEATRDLMVGFYRLLLAGVGRAEALRQAQLDLMRAGDRQHPFFWASFIAIGDWTPLVEKSALTTP